MKDSFFLLFVGIIFIIVGMFINIYVAHQSAYGDFKIEDIEDMKHLYFFGQINAMFYFVGLALILAGIFLLIADISNNNRIKSKVQPIPTKKHKYTVAEWGSKGLKYKKENFYDVALECFNKGLEIDPQDVKTLYNKGNVLVKLNRFKDAIECYNKVIKINPEHFDSWENRESALKKIEKKGESKDEEEVFELDEVYK